MLSTWMFVNNKLRRISGIQHIFSDGTLKDDNFMDAPSRYPKKSWGVQIKRYHNLNKFSSYQTTQDSFIFHTGETHWSQMAKFSAK
jgi:hypothetical protein